MTHDPKSLTLPARLTSLILYRKGIEANGEKESETGVQKGERPTAS